MQPLEIIYSHPWWTLIYLCVLTYLNPLVSIVISKSKEDEPNDP